MKTLNELEPKTVFKYFEEICHIPHGSGNINELSAYLVQFAKERELEYFLDAYKNVIIIKRRQKGLKRKNRSYCRDIWIWYAKKESIVRSTF